MEFLINNKNMRERIIRAVAGSMIIISLILAYTISINWIWFTAFIGFNLLQSSATKFCPLDYFLAKAKVGEPKGLKNTGK
jgi:hypothetical protein